MVIEKPTLSHLEKFDREAGGACWVTVVRPDTLVRLADIEENNLRLMVVLSVRDVLSSEIATDCMICGGVTDTECPDAIVVLVPRNDNATGAIGARLCS